jgi:protein PsiE
MGKYFKSFEKIVSTLVDIMLAILVLLVLVVMAEAIYKIITYVIPLSKVSDLSFLIEEIATLFILLEIILMLLRYVKEGHHIPVRYLILISITAILRELLLAQGKGLETLFLAFSILILIVVLQAIEKLKSFHRSKDI